MSMQSHIKFKTKATGVKCGRAEIQVSTYGVKRKFKQILSFDRVGKRLNTESEPD